MDELESVVLGGLALFFAMLVFVMGFFIGYTSGAIDVSKGEHVCAQLPDSRWECYDVPYNR